LHSSDDGDENGQLWLMLKLALLAGSILKRDRSSLDSLLHGVSGSKRSGGLDFAGVLCTLCDSDSDCFDSYEEHEQTKLI